MAKQFGFTRDQVLELTLEEIWLYTEWAQYYWQTEMAATIGGTIRRQMGA